MTTCLTFYVTKLKFWKKIIEISFGEKETNIFLRVLRSVGTDLFNPYGGLRSQLFCVHAFL